MKVLKALLSIADKKYERLAVEKMTIMYGIEEIE